MNLKPEDLAATEQSGQLLRKTIFPKPLPEHIDDPAITADIIHILNADILEAHQEVVQLRRTITTLHHIHQGPVRLHQTASILHHKADFPTIQRIQLQHHQGSSEALLPEMVTCSLHDLHGYLRDRTLLRHRLQ